MNEAISPLVVDTTITFNPIRVEMERGLGPATSSHQSVANIIGGQKKIRIDNVVF